MLVQVDMAYDELLEAVKKLPEEQKTRFKKELESTPVDNSEEDLIAFLLKGPTFSDQQIKAIEETRKAINKWRTKQ